MATEAMLRACIEELIDAGNKLLEKLETEYRIHNIDADPREEALAWHRCVHASSTIINRD
jgi:hypothetical protein